MNKKTRILALFLTLCLTISPAFVPGAAASTGSQTTTDTTQKDSASEQNQEDSTASNQDTDQKNDSDTTSDTSQDDTDNDQAPDEDSDKGQTDTDTDQDSDKNQTDSDTDQTDSSDRQDDTDEEEPETHASGDIVVAASENGTVTASTTNAQPGRRITLTVTPEENYELESLTVTDSEGEDVPVTRGSNNTTASFIMPDSWIKVQAEFSAIVPPEQHMVEAYTALNGTIRLSGDKFYPDETVSVTLIPDLGYEAESITVVNESGIPLEDVKLEGTAFVFPMPNSSVKISAVFHAREDAAALDTLISVTSENGTIGLSDRRAKAGETVQVLAIPDAGYQPDEIVVRDRFGNDVLTADCSTGIGTFTMPAASLQPVWVSATFQKAAEQEAPNPSALYSDLEQDAWYIPGINYVLYNDIMNGVTSTHFEPATTATRGMIVTLLYRLEGQPALGSAHSQFRDVPNSAWFAPAITWATEQKLVEGYYNRTFGPDDPITREQLATILYRYATYKGLNPTGTANLQQFGDAAKINTWAEPAMNWAVSNGLMDGMGNGLLEPDGNTSRAQVATLFMRYMQNIAK